MLTLGGKPLQLPILQGGMGVGVSLGGLAGAVAACGGMGCISTADAGYREPDFARDPAAANHRALTAEIQKAKAIAGGMGLVAINAMVATRDYAEAIRTAVAAGVDAVVSGAGLPLELPGIVGNITNFGAFVDIGIKENGLIHLSQLAQKYVSNPNEIVSIHQQVRVKVLSVDTERKRIQLTMIGVSG